MVAIFPHSVLGGEGDADAVADDDSDRGGESDGKSDGDGLPRHNVAIANHGDH